MDDDLKLLEDELKALRPAVPSKALRTAIGSKLARRSRLGRVVLAFAVGPLAAAAVWMLVVARDQTSAPVTSGGQTGEPAFKPVSAQNLLVASQDEGYVTLADGTTARRVRQSYLDTFTWKNPRTQASLHWTVPREEVRVVPISYQ